MNTWRELGPMADQPVTFRTPDGKRVSLSDTGLALEWVCVAWEFTLFLYGFVYGRRHEYRGRVLPDREAQWTEQRYEIPVEREIRIVLSAARGLTDRDIAPRLGRPQFEIAAIMEFHGYSHWNPLNKVSKPHKFVRSINPRWPAHLLAAITAADEVIEAFRDVFPRAPLAHENAMRREWEQLARVGKHFLDPGFGSVFQEEENLRVAATKDAMLERVVQLSSVGASVPWEMTFSSGGRRR